VGGGGGRPPVRDGTAGIWFSASVRVWEGSSSKPRPAGETAEILRPGRTAPQYAPARSTDGRQGVDPPSSTTGPPNGNTDIPRPLAKKT